MSNNKEDTQASPVFDAQAGATGRQDSPSDQQQSGSELPNRPRSRFYSRMGKPKSAGSVPAAAAAQAPAFTEGVSPAEAVRLRDNLPVRATVDPSLQDGEDRPERPRRERASSAQGRPDDEGRERRGRRRRSRDRDDERRPRRESDAHSREAETAEPEPEALAEAIDPSPEDPASTQTRRLRFEDAGERGSSGAVQEFRPSSERQYAHDASRAREQKSRARMSKPEPRPKDSGGLFGWVKSIFGSTDNGEPEVEAPKPDRPSRGSSGSRKRGSGAPRADAGSKGGKPGGQNRRRRRRGGRNRQNRGGGDTSPNS